MQLRCWDIRHEPFPRSLEATDEREVLRISCDLALFSFIYNVFTATANFLRDAR